MEERRRAWENLVSDRQHQLRENFYPAPAPQRVKEPGARPPDFDPSEAAVVELQALNREGRLKSGDIEADRPGRSFESAGTKRHAMSRNVDPKNKRRSRLLTVSPSVWKR